MNISLTDREIEILTSVCIEYIEMLGEGEETHDYTEYMIDTGLGSALRKIGKGRNLAKVFGNYKTVGSYPSFEEWKMKKLQEEGEEE